MTNIESSAEKPSAQDQGAQTKKIRRAIFLVHGVGSKKKGEFMTSVLNPLLVFLRNTLGREHVHVEAHQRPVSGLAKATITVGDEVWDVREVWWEESFYPMSQQKVLKWGFKVLWRNAANFVRGMFPLLRDKMENREADPPYTRQPHHWTACVYDFFAGAAALIILVAAYVPLMLAASVLYLLGTLPNILVFPAFSQRLVMKLVSAIVAGPGDQLALMYADVARSSTTRTMVDIMDDCVYAGSHQSITVIAHSGGRMSRSQRSPIRTDRRCFRILTQSRFRPH
jgi:hypothetical protein